MEAESAQVQELKIMRATGAKRSIKLAPGFRMLYDFLSIYTDFKGVPGVSKSVRKA